MIIPTLAIVSLSINRLRFGALRIRSSSHERWVLERKMSRHPPNTNKIDWHRPAEGPLKSLSEAGIIVGFKKLVGKRELLQIIL